MKIRFDKETKETDSNKPHGNRRRLAQSVIKLFEEDVKLKEFMKRTITNDK